MPLLRDAQVEHGPRPLDYDRQKAAFQHYQSCMLCEHRCGVNRAGGEVGLCKADAQLRMFRHRIEYSEETDLVPSHLFYLSGCDLRCVFCIAGINAFDPTRGEELTPALFQQAVAWGRAQGARNIQWIGGEPTIHLPGILDLMERCPDLPPVIWKSDFHFTPEALSLLAGRVDVYIADFKFGNDACAARLGGGDNYVEIVTRNLKMANKQGRLIVRHLLLPGHFECCFKPIVRWIQLNLPDTEFSLREGYLPSWRSQRFTELRLPLQRAEQHAAREWLNNLGLRVIQ
jgi:putative pyruvate formate lyase activating enzyme